LFPHRTIHGKNPLSKKEPLIKLNTRQRKKASKGFERIYGRQNLLTRCISRIEMEQSYEKKLN
jgi:hypothetical protein